MRNSLNQARNKEVEENQANWNRASTMASTSSSAASTTSAQSTNSDSNTASSSQQLLENYLTELKRVIEWLVASEQQLINQNDIGTDVNIVKQQFQTHEDFMLELTKHQNSVGLVLQEGSRLINSGSISADDDVEIRKQMKLLNDMWESLRLHAVERQSKLHEMLMKLQNEQLNQMDAWLSNAEQRQGRLSQLADSLDGLIEQKNELAAFQDDLVKEQEAVDCLKQIIVVVDDSTEEQAFTLLENKLANLSDRWSNVCKFVGTRWCVIQELIIKLQNIENDFAELNKWISNKSIQLNSLIKRIEPIVQTSLIADNLAKESISHKLMTFSDEKERELEQEFDEMFKVFDFTSSIQLIKILKEIEYEMQIMHAKLNDMNDIGEQIGTQLSNSPQLTNSINNKMDVLEQKWNALLEQMEYLSKVCTQLQHNELNGKVRSSKHSPPTHTVADQPTVAIISVQHQDLNKEQSILAFVTELEAMFDRVNALVAHSDNSSIEEQQEALKVLFFLSFF